MITGQQISIQAGGAVGHGAVVVGMLHGSVSAQTEKAVQFRTDNGKTCWFPRAALVEDKRATGFYKFARWFKPEGYTAQFILNNRSFGGQSVV